MPGESEAHEGLWHIACSIRNIHIEVVLWVCSSLSQNTMWGYFPITHMPVFGATMWKHTSPSWIQYSQLASWTRVYQSTPSLIPFPLSHTYEHPPGQCSSPPDEISTDQWGRTDLIWVEDMHHMWKWCSSTKWAHVHIHTLWNDYMVELRQPHLCI